MNNFKTSGNILISSLKPVCRQSEMASEKKRLEICRLKREAKNDNDIFSAAEYRHTLKKTFVPGLRLRSL